MTPLTSLALALAVAQAPQQTPPPAAPAPGAPQGPAAMAPAAPQAQPAGARTILLLDDALRAAAEQNFDLKAAQARLRQAEELHWKAWSGYLPQINAGGQYTHNSASAVLPAGSLGPGSPEITIQAQDQFAGQARIDQALFAPQLFFAIPNARRGEEIARLTNETTRREVLFGVAQTYYAVSALNRAVEVAQRLLEVAQRQEKDARVRYQAGAVAKVALLRAEIDRARAEQDLKRSQNSYESARLALATLLARPADFEVADPPDVQLAGDAASFEEMALQNRPEVRANRINVDLQRGNKGAVIAGYLPNVGLFGQYLVSNQAGFTGQKDSWATGVAFTWRIFDGGRRESDVREASARIDEASATSSSVELQTRLEVRQAYLDMESARANAAKAKEQRDLAAENQRLVDVAFRAGTATAVEQADATAQLRTAEINAITEALNAQLAAIRVLKAAGAFHPTRR
ncbi:TolC family protein [Anaeromyxobacter oryzae]|uniref:RND transporter n=1 Tax=Anaeromyxobacter oryzae TaxID=2918170 RepID=A0ABM7WU52_9BACT|nr:TolC family protein [Anaeromyxobacter oryzae]BDG03031.1 RND transporter [Anaeromyxobacter oryzae]